MLEVGKRGGTPAEIISVAIEHPPIFHWGYSTMAMTMAPPSWEITSFTIVIIIINHLQLELHFQAVNHQAPWFSKCLKKIVSESSKCPWLRPQGADRRWNAPERRPGGKDLVNHGWLPKMNQICGFKMELHFEPE